jgi:hypothetical protein
VLAEFFLVCQKVRFFYRQLRMGESDYLNDNALRKMDIFLSLLFSEESVFFYAYKSFQQSLISGQNVPCTLYSR